MSRHASETRDVYTDAGELRGVWTRGAEPKELVLWTARGWRCSPPSADRCSGGAPRARDGDGGTLSVGEALDLAGDEFADYVTVRTRAEAGWLRAVADWCGGEAERLERELSGNGRTLALALRCTRRPWRVRA